jgi:hypothetical protein
MSKTGIVGVLGLVALGIVIWAFATRERWGPNLSTDPAYRSGRESVCKAAKALGPVMPSNVQDFGLKPVGRGFDRTRAYTFDASRLAGGSIDVCSEYGFVKVAGIAGNEGRVEIQVSSPFPSGEIAIEDTQVAFEPRVVAGRLQIGVAQRTQGVTSFRSWAARGSRPAEVNVTVLVPQSGPYALSLTANHQRITIRDLDVSGTLEGYGSPGADIDAGLDGDLKVRLSGVSYQSRFAGVENVQGGTTAKLRPRRSGKVEFALDQSALRIELVGDKLGLEITANGSASNEIQIGPTASSRVEAATAYAQGEGFAQAAVQLSVHASSANGSVSVRRTSQ